jgi:hypothetical protein
MQFLACLSQAVIWGPPPLPPASPQQVSGGERTPVGMEAEQGEREKGKPCIWVVISAPVTDVLSSFLQVIV